MSLTLLAGLGLAGTKAARAQFMEIAAHDDVHPICTVVMGTSKIIVNVPNPGCLESRNDPAADSPPVNKQIVSVHRPPSQTWQPAAETNFATNTHFLVGKEKECETAFGLADKGNGAPARYVCENRKDHKPYAELQCDGGRHLQNCYGLRYQNGVPRHMPLRIRASLR